MGTKRVGLARVEALIENLKRDLNLTGSSLSGLTSLAAAVQTVAAAGANQGNAAAIAATAPIVLVTGADDTKGARLPALADVATGAIFIIGNGVKNKALKLYPATDDEFAGHGDNAGLVGGNGAGFIVAKIDAAKWLVIESSVVA